MRRVPRAARVKQSFTLARRIRLRPLFHNITYADRAHLALLFPYALHGLCVCRWTQLVAALNPHLLQLALDLRPTQLPLFDLGEPLTQLGEFLFNRGLLGCGPDAGELPFFARLAQAKREEVRVVALQGGAGGYCYQGWDS